MNTVAKADGNREKIDLPRIALPVFRRISVEGYELFPGRNETGLHHNFESGVTVIAGINGLGKTTLLNVMLRLLLGPFNPEKATPFEVGASSHELVGWGQARRFFSSRVTDEAAHAIATAEFTIGAHHVMVSRRLRDLSITSLAYDGQSLEPLEGEYERVVLEASNAAVRYDFDFLVRYLVFFLEQRVPLFWNDRGQVETFRILLCDAGLADAFRKKQDEIQSKDSLYRNQRWQAGKRQKELIKRLASEAGATSLNAQAAALQESYKTYSEKNRILTRNIEEASSERSDARSKLLLSKIELEETRREYEGLQQNYLTALFPNLEESARHLFRTLLSNQGCVLCGNRSARGYERLQHLLAHGNCPACESPAGEQEEHVETQLPDQHLIKAASDKLLRIQRAVRALEDKERLSDQKVRDLLGEQRQVRQALHKVGSDLESIKTRLPATPEEIKALEHRVEDDNRVMVDMLAELDGLYLQYEEMVQEVHRRVQQVANDVQKYFSQFAKSFLAERCYLGFATYKEKVGQLREFEYPCFNVFMTSGTSPDREVVRTEPEDVSESQREFIDLAFRMALIASVTAQSRSMLVIETPEASLDAFFIDQAGELLRQFGRGHQTDGNVVIVSSNLARQNMIGALLGFSGTNEDRWPSSTHVRKRIINLLDECAENAALRERRDFYEDALHSATKKRLVEDYE